MLKKLGIILGSMTVLGGIIGGIYMYCKRKPMVTEKYCEDVDLSNEKDI